MLLTPAPLTFALIAVPWYWFCYARNGEAFIQEFFIRHNVQRVLSGEAIGHPQPFWFYLPILLAALFPWTSALLLPVVTLAKRSRSIFKDPQQIFLFYWILLPFVFFSLAENKLPGYLLPILPPLALWIGAAVAERYNDAGSRWLLRGVILGAALLLLALSPAIVVLLPESLATGLGTALAQARTAGVWEQITDGPVPLVAWVVLIGLVIFTAALLWRSRTLAAGFSVALGVAWVVLLLTTYLAPAINRVASVRTMAASLREDGINPRSLAVLYLHRNQIYGLGFYLSSLPQPWEMNGGMGWIQFVAAREDLVEGQVQPGARPISWFPGQRVRLWSVGPELTSAPLASTRSDALPVK
jgi:hypothetical protein